MIKIDVLDKFTFYRTSSEIIAPEDPRKPKSNSLYVILGPNVADALSWCANSDKPLTFRHLYRYFIPKYVDIKLYGISKTRQEVEEIYQTNEIVSALKGDTSKQFKNINYVSMKPKQSGDMLKGFNVLYDVNYTIQSVLENPKDKRALYHKSNDIVEKLKFALQEQFEAYNLNRYTKRTVFIPLDLWSGFGRIDSVSIYKLNSKHPFGQIFGKIFNDIKLFNEVFEGYNVVLLNQNELMVMDSIDLTINRLDKLKEFIRRCKSTDTYIEIEPDNNEQSGLVVTAEEESEIDDKVNQTVSRIIPDTKTVPKEMVDDLVRVVKDSENRSDAAGIIPTTPDTTKNQEALDIITKARLAGQSVGNYQRNEMLKKKYMDLTIDNVPISKLIETEEKYDVPDKELNINTVNDAYKSIKSHNFEKAYNDQLFMHHLARILIHFSTANPALYLIDDPKIEDISTNFDKLYMVSVTYEDENRRRHSFKFKLPKMYQDKYLFLNEQKWNIVHQKTPFPVTKTSPINSQVVSNYNKIRMERYGQNISAKMTKLKKVLEGAEKPVQVKTVRGNNVKLNTAELTTVEYDELAARFSKIIIKDTTIYFNVSEARAVCPKPNNKITQDNIIPLATNRRAGKYYYLSGTSNKVYCSNGESWDNLSDWIIEHISQHVKDFHEQFAKLSPGSKFIYTRAAIMSANIPLILVLGAADPGGLHAVLEKAGIHYTFSDTRPRDLDTDNKGVVQFKDGYLIFDRYPYENSLLLNGLSVLPPKVYSFNDLDDRDMYVEIFDLLYDSRTLIDGIENFYYLEIDPITEEILKSLNMPTDFTKLLLYANGILADNSYDMDSDYNNSRLRSNEIVLGYLYDLLCKAYARFKRGDKFSIKEDALIKALLTSPIVDPHSKLNVTLEAENDRQVKLSGLHGMNQSRAYTLEKRAYHPNMQGIIGMNTTPSGEVGINRHMVLNSNIVDARGFVNINKGEYDGTELETPGELLNPFDTESADPERVAMAISQSKHLVPVENATPALVNYDMERVIPHISNDYAFEADKDGEVVEISNEIMIIKYSDGTYADIDLAERADKNTDGGFYITNRLVAQYKVGDKFKAGDIIAYDPKYITARDDFGDNLSTTGTLARVAIVSNGAVFEDATYVTDALCEKMSSRITVEKVVHLSRFSNIKYIAKKGQKISANEAILYFDDTEDEFSSQMLAQLAAEAGDDDEISATSAPVFSKVSGVIKDIKIYYTCETDMMTPSLKKVVDDYNKEINKRHKVISKYMDPRDSNSIIPPATVSEPDMAGRVKGKKMPKEVMIEFFIEYIDKYSTGDKISHQYALKGVNSFVIPKGQEGFTLFNPERKIDAYLSTIGLFKRMVLSLEKSGSLTKILIEKKRLMKNKYLDEINRKLR